MAAKRVQTKSEAKRHFVQFLHQRHANTKKTIMLTGTAYIKQSHAFSIDGTKTLKIVKISVATSHAIPADRIEIRYLFLLECCVRVSIIFSEWSETISSIDTPKIWLMESKTDTSGIASPLSHFEIDLSEKLIFSANSLCVQFCDFR